MIRFSVYAIASIADRGLSFLLPLVVLADAGAVDFYNILEAALGIASIAAIFADCGVRIFFMYGYLNAVECGWNRSAFIHSVWEVEKRVWVALGLFSLCCWIINGPIVFSLILARTAYLCSTQFCYIYGRAIEAPVLPIVLSIGLQLIILSVALMADSTSDYHFVFLLYFLMPALYLVAYRLPWQRSSSLARGPRVAIARLVSSALRYAFPIMLNAGMVLFISGISKVYAYRTLVADEASVTNGSLRLAMAVQLFHSVFCGYQQRRMMDKGVGFSSLTVPYLALLICVALATAFGAQHMVTETLPQLHSRFLEIALAVVYTFLWCVGGYFELYCNRVGLTSRVMIGSSAGLAVYLGGLAVCNIDTAAALLAIMTASSLVYAFTNYFVYRRIESRRG